MSRQVVCPPDMARHPEVLAAAEKYEAVITPNKYVEPGTYLIFDPEGTLPREGDR